MTGIQTPEKSMVRLTQLSFRQRPDKTVVRGARNAGEVRESFFRGTWFRRSSGRRNRSPGQTSNGFFALTEPARARVPRVGADNEAAVVRIMGEC